MSVPLAPAAEPSITTTRPLALRVLDAPVRWAALDRVAAPLASLVHAAEPRWLADLLHGTFLSHPLHPVLAQLTVGSWTSASLLDGLSLAGLVPDELADGAEAASVTLLATGLASALPTFAAGWTDWSDLHEDQQRIGLVHAAGNYTATALYLVSLVQRRRSRTVSGRWWSLAATAVATAGAALGGHLSYRWAAGANHAEHVPHRAGENWEAVADWADLPEATPVKSRVGDVDVVVVRLPDGVRVLADTCSHLSAPLSQGTVRVTGSGPGAQACIECPWHHSEFRLEDGSVVHGPATSPQPTFAARVEADGTVLARVVQVA